MKGYYFITDTQLSLQGNINDIKAAIAAGVKIVQYRNKKADTKALFEEACLLRNLCRDITFIVNDRIDIALAVNADGVHLGQEDMPLQIARKLMDKDKIIGITVSNLSQAKEAVDNGADYLGVSPIFSTTTKVDAGSPCGIELLKQIKRSYSIPLVAIGGISLDNVKQTITAGTDAVCAISAVVTKNDVKSEILNFMRFFI